MHSMQSMQSVQMEQVSYTLEISPAGWTEQAVRADFCEPARKNVLEESPDERIHREGHTFRCVRARVGVAEGDAPVLEALDALVRQSDAVHVA